MIVLSTRKILKVKILPNTKQYGIYPFTISRSAGVPRVAIVLTDGRSNYPEKTLAAAKRFHNAEIVAFAVGVGPKIDLKELANIASTPECQHLSLLRNFDEIDYLKYAIEARSCKGRHLYCSYICTVLYFIVSYLIVLYILDSIALYTIMLYCVLFLCCIVLYLL